MSVWMHTIWPVLAVIRIVFRLGIHLLDYVRMFLQYLQLQYNHKM